MNRLPLEPQINQDASFMFALKARLREIAKSFNAAADQVDTNTATIASKADIASPTLTGDPKAPTPPNTDNDTSIATTAWVRSAMANIASTAGFASSMSAIGYLKMPNWLGGWVIQWGVILGSSAGETTVTYPIAFPGTALIAVGTVPSNAVGYVASVNGLGPTSMTVSAWSGVARQVANIYWIAVGA